MQLEPEFAEVGATRSVFKRIFIDASHAHKSRRNTGVQRVVRSLCRCLPLVETAPPTHVVTLHGRNFSAVPSLAENRAEKERLSGLFRLAKRAVERVLEKTQSRAPVNFAPGDLLLLADAYWIKPEVWQAVQSAREQGAFVVSIVYDLIPITHPQFVSVKGQHAFQVYVECLAAHSDMMLAISQTVCEELRNCLPKRLSSGNFCRDARYFTLGAQFATHLGPIREHIRRIFPGQGEPNPFLMVATFDPRKN